MVDVADAVASPRWHGSVLMREFSRDGISVSDMLLPAGIDSWQRTPMVRKTRVSPSSKAGACRGCGLPRCG
jgi:hypothetical protein